jgi:thiamine pyrophosphate-dependent acetolactate synthase large subunit-like protein
MDYWPKTAKIIQIDADHKMLGLVKKISVGICGDAKAAAELSSAWPAHAGLRRHRARAPTPSPRKRPPGRRRTSGPTSATRTAWT